MKLFEKGTIGNLEIKNRIVMAAMGIRGLTEPPDGDWGERVRAYYEARAAGGVLKSARTVYTKCGTRKPMLSGKTPAWSAGPVQRTARQKP